MSNATMLRVTMTDVARKAGVSIKTVSRVINGEAHVSQKVREKVQQAVSILGYVPDVAARSLAGNRAFTIGVLFDNPSPNYKMKVHAGAYEACRNAGYHLRHDELEPGTAASEVTAQIEQILNAGRCDGFVLTPPLTDRAEVLDLLETRGVPYVRIAPVLDPGRSRAVEMDDYRAAGDVARMLCKLGHRRVALVQGPSHHGRSAHRRNGFVDAFRSLAPDGPPPLEENGDFTFYSGMIAGKRLFGREDAPTAVFALNDDMAAGVINAAQQLGLRVPEDVSVCGFDDGIIAVTVWPYLTTVHQPIAEMASAAVSMLIERSAGGETRSIGYWLVERDSVAPPRATGS